MNPAINFMYSKAIIKINPTVSVELELKRLCCSNCLSGFFFGVFNSKALSLNSYCKLWKGVQLLLSFNLMKNITLLSSYKYYCYCSWNPEDYLIKTNEKEAYWNYEDLVIGMKLKKQLQIMGIVIIIIRMSMEQSWKVLYLNKRILPCEKQTSKRTNQSGYLFEIYKTTINYTV